MCHAHLGYAVAGIMHMQCWLLAVWMRTACPFSYIDLQLPRYTYGYKCYGIESKTQAWIFQTHFSAIQGMDW